MDAVRAAHVLAQGVLLGGALAVWALAGRGEARDAARLYEWAFWAAAGVSVLTGVGNAAVHGLRGGLGTTWGALFAVKLALVLAGLAVAAYRTLALAHGRVWRAGYGLTALGVAAATVMGSVMAHG